MCFLNFDSTRYPYSYWSIFVFFLCDEAERINRFRKRTSILCQSFWKLRPPHASLNSRPRLIKRSLPTILVFPIFFKMCAYLWHAAPQAGRRVSVWSILRASWFIHRTSKYSSGGLRFKTPPQYICDSYIYAPCVYTVRHGIQLWREFSKDKTMA